MWQNDNKVKEGLSKDVTSKLRPGWMQEPQCLETKQGPSRWRDQKAQRSEAGKKMVGQRGDRDGGRMWAQRRAPVRSGGKASRSQQTVGHGPNLFHWLFLFKLKKFY